MMTEVLFCLSVGFVAYVVYVLVNEQRTPIPIMPEQPNIKIKPTRLGATRKTTKVTKAKSASAIKSTETTIKKTAQNADNVTSDPVVAYLSKNGLTTIAKLSRDLPESRKTVEDRIARLIQEGTISQTTVGRAKAVTLKA
jgi:predicted HTH transcriptional regulator